MTGPNVYNVFGVKKDLVLSYIEREKVDAKFIEALKGDKHIVVYGSSKQGKSALILKHIEKDNAVKISCSTNMTTKHIFESLIRQAGVQIYVSEEKVEGTSGQFSVRTGFRAMIPFLGQADAELKSEIGGKTDKKDIFKAVEVNVEIAQDICELLQQINFRKFIIIDNFHYLTEEVQYNLAFDLRAFQENGFRFIILGIWREKNRLAQFNGELDDRLIEIPVEPWNSQEFDEIIKKGSNILNINYTEEMISKIKQLSFGNIGIVQELCKETCLSAGIENNHDHSITFLEMGNLQKAIEKKTEDYSSRHIRCLESISDYGVQKEGLYMPYYLIRAIIEKNIDELLNGISRNDLHEHIKRIHYRPDSVRSSDISYLLHGLANIQSNKKINPPLFDYDRVNRRLRIIDSTLLFFLEYKDRQEILEEIPDPLEK